MSAQPISRQAPVELSTDSDARGERPNVEDQRRSAPRSPRPRRAHTPGAVPAHPAFAGRPHGHVVGHGIGDPPPHSLADRPRGHVVGHAVARHLGRR